MKTRYFRHPVPLIVPAMLLALASCSNPVSQSVLSSSGLDEPGALLVSFAALESSRSAEPDTWREQVDSYELVLSGDQAMGPLFTAETEILLEDLPAGTYTVSVTASDSGGNILAAGSLADSEVSGDGVQEIHVDLTPVMGGTGTLTIGYDWSGAGFASGYISHVIASITVAGGSSRPVAVELAENGLVFSDELPSGTFEFSCELFAGGQLVSTMTEVMQVFDGLETESVMNLDADDFESVPVPPAALPAVQDGLNVELTWEDTGDTESGFRVYRSTDVGGFELMGDDIPANTTSWTDGPVEPGREYVYRVVALNDFGESEASETAIIINPLVEPPGTGIQIDSDIVIGSDSNTIPFPDLTDGFINNLNRSSLKVVSVSLSGGGEAGISGDTVVIDTSSIPYESEGGELILEYEVHITGEPMNSSYTATGTAVITLQAPEVEEVQEDDLLDPVTAYVYDNRDDLERRMNTYDPPGSDEIFKLWGRIVGPDYFTDGSEAGNSRRSKGDNAEMALQWKLKQQAGDSYIEYAKNSVYTGFVSPEGEESDSFTLEATVSSKDADDDVVGLIVAYIREDGGNYVLEAGRSHGAVSGETSLEPSLGWGLVVRKLVPGGAELGEVVWSRQLDVGGIGRKGWSGTESRLKVVRKGDDVSVYASDWDDAGSYAPDSEISISLASSSELKRFRGKAGYGYFVASQERSSFRDLVVDTGHVGDKIFLLDPETGESEVWWYDTTSGRWLPAGGASIQDTLGYPREVTNPDTGITYLVERKRIRTGSWKDLWDRWSSWKRWASGNRHRDGKDDGED